ncbi:MAG: riboflavin synthase [Gammaproteobacteria bacterium]|nr:MAG: riboflavin synthase [Gammaproteobacteria bacterium]RLA14928.1 MAG: riboflavin synthase [Gammaproteobacteria bacterium]
MFTGIIGEVGQLQRSDSRGGDRRLLIQASGLPLESMELGESVAVNGVCLTLVEINEDSFAADVSTETLSCTSLGDLTAGAAVNLERALTLNQPLGGHLVSGHVDGLGKVTAIRPDGRSTRFDFQVPKALLRYIAAKGSITIDGTSLTVNTISDQGFSVNIIPHTMERTIIGEYQTGRAVNLEVDLIARYLERLMTGTAIVDNATVTIDLLRDNGML